MRMTEQSSIADDVIRVIAPALEDRVIIVLPDSKDSRLRLVHEAFEARIWKDKHGYSYEIVFLGAVMARGEAGSAYAALERTRVRVGCLCSSAIVHSDGEQSAAIPVGDRLQVMKPALGKRSEAGGSKSAGLSKSKPPDGGTTQAK